MNKLRISESLPLLDSLMSKESGEKWEFMESQIAQNGILFKNFWDKSFMSMIKGGPPEERRKEGKTGGVHR